MPTKPDDQKATGATIPVRVPAPLKKDIDEMAASTGVPTSQRVRLFLEAEVRKWKQRPKS